MSKRKPQDATIRNIRAARKRRDAANKRIDLVESAIIALDARLKRLEPDPAFAPPASPAPDDLTQSPIAALGQRIKRFYVGD